MQQAIVMAAMLMAIVKPVLSAETPTEENIGWSDYIIPLPHEMTVSSTIRLAPDQIGFVVPADASPMVTQAVAELRAAYQAQSGCTPTGTAFMIHIGRLSKENRINDRTVEGADRLKSSPNSDQVYLVRPIGSNALAVVGLNDKGVFYGIQTLRQLLTAKLTKTEAVVPLAVVTDWPDFEERGFWNSGLMTPELIPWVAGLKLNFEHIPHGINFARKAEKD